MQLFWWLCSKNREEMVRVPQKLEVELPINLWHLQHAVKYV